MTAPYRFDRYKNGTKMAEGIKVTKESCFFDAIKVAARLADPGDVLVYDADVSDARVAQAREDALREAAEKAGEAAVNVLLRHEPDASALRRQTANQAAKTFILALISEDKTNG